MRVKSANKINVGRPTFRSGVVMVKYCVVLCLQTSIYSKESGDSWTIYMTNDQSKSALQ